MNTNASIFVYKFRPERTGFNMYAEYRKLQLTFFTLQPCPQLRCWHVYCSNIQYTDNEWIERRGRIHF